MAGRTHIPEYERALAARMDKAVREYGMLQAGDRILVAVSGGADSMALLHLLSRRLAVYAPAGLLRAVYVDIGFGEESETRCRIMRDYWRQLGVSGRILRTAIGPLAHSEDNNKNPCFLCSRLRRKRIFEIAGEMGCNKVAFAHHQDDLIETLLINMFYGREISTMMPDQPIFGGAMHIIRPLAYLREGLVKKYSRECAFPVIESACPTGPVSRRKYVKDLLDQVEKDNKDVRANIFKAMSHVKTDYLPGPPRPRRPVSREMEPAAIASVDADR